MSQLSAMILGTHRFTPPQGTARLVTFRKPVEISEDEESEKRSSFREKHPQVRHGIETREKIVELIKCGIQTVDDLSKKFEISHTAINKHLRKLEKSGLIYRTRDSRNNKNFWNAKTNEEA